MKVGSTRDPGVWHPTIDTSALLAAARRARFLAERPVVHCSVAVLLA